MQVRVRIEQLVLAIVLYLPQSDRKFKVSNTLVLLISRRNRWKTGRLKFCMARCCLDDIEATERADLWLHAATLTGPNIRPDIPRHGSSLFTLWLKIWNISPSYGKRERVSLRQRKRTGRAIRFLFLVKAPFDLLRPYFHVGSAIF